MQTVAASVLVFLGGFTIMVLEVIGARFLAKDFGSSFYVWVSQIGIILTALMFGYYAGGALADRFQRASPLIYFLLPSGILICVIPNYAPPLMNLIIDRHPLNEDIPMLWQKLDPALGSLVLFGVPCFVLASLSPYMIRLASSRVAHVGTVSGRVYAASTAGSIAGVFLSGYVLVDLVNLSHIFRAAGCLTVALCGLCWCIDRGRALPATHTAPGPC